MSENYFQKFPTIEYNGKDVIDLTRRVKVADTFFRIPTAYYKYEVINDDRPDNLAYFLYEDPSLAWVHYLMNGITDPYYDWYLSDEQLTSLIVNKYGSLENAQQKTAFYRNNWSSDDSEISTSYYENNLPGTLKKYWSPVFGQGTSVLSYKRNQDDVVVNTNKILSLTIDVVSGNNVVNGEILDFKTNTNEIVGRSEVIKEANATTVMVQHIVGIVNTSLTAVGRESNTVLDITDYTTLITNLTDDEFVYWEPVTLFDVENERNEKNKIINLLQPPYTLSMAESLRQKMKE